MIMNDQGFIPQYLETSTSLYQNQLTHDHAIVSHNTFLQNQQKEVESLVKAI